MRLTTSLFKGFLAINRQNKYLFASQQKKQGNKIFKFIKSAWQQTFPDQQTQVRNKYQKIKQQKHFTKQQIQKIQQQIPQYSRTAITQTQIKAQQQKAKFHLGKLIPQSIKNKIKQSESYKQMSGFKQNLKQYMSTRDGVVANAATMAYGAVANQSPMAKATSLMRNYIKDFSMFDLQKQSTVLFKDAYNAFLSEDTQKLEKMANQQAIQYFNAHIRLNKTKKQKSKYNQLVFVRQSRLKKANVGQKLLPTFEFQITIMDIYCMVNSQGVVVDGDQQRVNQSVFEFQIGYSGNHIDTLGHPWQIVEIKKIQQIKLLV